MAPRAAGAQTTASIGRIRAGSRRSLVLIAAAAGLLCAGAPAAARAAGSGHAVSGYGLRLVVPPGWAGHVRPGEIDALATRGNRVDASVQLDAVEAPHVRFRPLPRRVGAGTTRRFVRVGGRTFFLFVHTTAQRLAATDGVLASVAARPWTGPLAPPRFPDAAGWHTGSSGPQPRYGNAYVSAWASTAPYENSPVDLPPAATLARLGRSGIAVWIGLSSSDYDQPVRRDPLDLGKARCTRAWEGAIPGVMQCVLWSRLPGRYDVSVYVYVERRSRLAAAQAELRRVVLPRWPK